MIRGLLRLSLLGAGTAWLADRLLRRRAAGPPPTIPLMIVIDAPIEAVWRVISDIEGQPRWMHDMKTVRMSTPGPIRVGSRGEATVRMYGLSSADPVTVTAFDPPTTFAISHDGTFTGGGTFRLEPGADGTTTIVRWEETLVAPILPHLAAVVTAPVFRHVFQRDLERLRDLIESGVHRAPGAR
jgi:uncharacterized protein YndB with AHSA1/START domain